ncbi:unnamed protein product [Cochlearia groenlandica]
MVDYEKTSQSVDIICDETLRYSFVSHLSAALRRAGISISVSAFADLDSDYLNEKSRVSVVVFSETIRLFQNWRDKFHKTLQLRRKESQKVIPVFYGVDPSSVFVYPYQEWQGMLQEGHYSRYSNDTIRNSELLEEIVSDVYGKILPAERIGIYSRLVEIENLLCEQPWGVRSLGLWGMPGIGKTTLAKALFEQMCNDYDASCFIDNFDETLHKVGPHRLLEDKIGSFLREKCGVNTSCITRLSLLKDKLCDSRILVVLDDVRNPLAAESFLGRLDWFGPGSLIIITSRYKQVFALCQVNHIYKVPGLSKDEAMQLFSQSAFEKAMPELNDRELSMKVVEYANGNPLALRIYGRELNGRKHEMETAFLELKRFPPQNIQDRLKSVYSALGDNEKFIFLDVACFFKGENVEYVVHLLKDCGYFPRVGIDVLVEKCLVTISENALQMDDLVQDIIREIIIGERLQMKKCTTLWLPSSIRDLLEDELEADEEPKETSECLHVAEDIKGISLNTSKLKFDVNPDAFKKLDSLRFLKVYSSCSENVHELNFPKGLNSLPCELRLLHWENYPFESLPQGFDLRELVELNMPYSQLKKLRPRTKNLEMLKRIRLCHSKQLVKFSIHGYAQNIELIDLQGCIGLESLPAMTKLEHLRVLNLTGCKTLKTVAGLPPNIEELYLQGTSIEEMPISIVARSSQPDCKELMNHMKHFPGLEHIDLETAKNLINVSSYSQGFDKLVRLNMKDCINLRGLPEMFNIESLRILDVSGCFQLEEIKAFPRNLKELYLAGTSLRELPEFPTSLEFLNAYDCDLLKSVRLDFEQLPRHYTFSNCFNLFSETIIEFIEKSLPRVIRLAREQDQVQTKAPALNVCLPAYVCLPSSFHWQASSFVMVELAPCTRKALSGFAMSVVVSFRSDSHNVVGLGIRCICKWETKTGHHETIEKIFKCWDPKEAPRVVEDHIFVLYDAEMHPGGGEGMDQIMSTNKLKFEFDTVSSENKPLGANCVVKKCDVKVIMDSNGDVSFSAGSRRASEDMNNIYELPPPLPEKAETKICSSPSSKRHKLSTTVASNMKPKLSALSKWVGCVPRVRRIKREKLQIKV